MDKIWKFTHFTSKQYLWHEKWDRDNRDLLEEIMLITECIEPLNGKSRMKMSTHYGSRNAWYHYKKRLDGKVEVWPSGENVDYPYQKPHYVFECWR